MPSKKGKIVLMGSGELTATMVEVHKDLLGGRTAPPHAVFLDTPAGFQLNVDELSRRAVEYFRVHVQQPMSVASFKSSETTTPYEAEQAFHALRQADFVLIGPGSPTYAVRQLQPTPVPEILRQRIADGACLVAASAAALTVGCFTLPVYEIYKVGAELYWVEGMNILGHFGFNLVVIPHWNNAEGGTHDTRFCYMGKPRFRKLEALLPRDVGILGLDEHTACLLDLAAEEAEIRGIGRMTLRRRGAEVVFEKGDRLALEVLRGGDPGPRRKPSRPRRTPSEPNSEATRDSFWNRVHALEARFHTGLEQHDPQAPTNALLELDRTIWQAQQDLESAEFISQARDLLRELIVHLGVRIASVPRTQADCLGPLVEDLLALRAQFRQKKLWQEADALRASLQRAKIIVEDTADGSRWRLEAGTGDRKIEGNAQ
ncbi:MAG: hypothetical protein JSW39_03200 [Desulfobacterales bacterium]|nr:MAG: hypothetical protein JSW39_03200 [Desulfobacterales bacterium]